jgi:hypothetical protein
MATRDTNHKHNANTRNNPKNASETDKIVQLLMEMADIQKKLAAKAWGKDSAECKTITGIVEKLAGLLPKESNTMISEPQETTLILQPRPVQEKAVPETEIVLEIVPEQKVAPLPPKPAQLAKAPASAEDPHDSFADFEIALDAMMSHPEKTTPAPVKQEPDIEADFEIKPIAAKVEQKIEETVKPVAKGSEDPTEEIDLEELSGKK